MRKMSWLQIYSDSSARILWKRGVRTVMTVVLLLPLLLIGIATSAQADSDNTCNMDWRLPNGTTHYLTHYQTNWRVKKSAWHEPWPPLTDLPLEWTLEKTRKEWRTRNVFYYKCTILFHYGARAKVRVESKEKTETQVRRVRVFRAIYTTIRYTDKDAWDTTNKIYLLYNTRELWIS